MRIALAQINPIIGDINHNANKIISIVNESKEKADLIIFPELSLIGYPPKDLLLRREFIERSLEIVGQKISNNIEIPTLIGLVTKVWKNGKLFNSMVLINHGKVKQIFHKKLLPNYEVFNESRYFQPSKIEGVEDFVFEIEGKKIAILICEDLLGAEINFAFYGMNPLDYLAKNINLDLAICTAASPFRKGKNHKRIELAQIAQQKLQCPIAVVNQVGANDDLIFDGSSFFLNKNGFIHSMAKSFEEDILICDLNDLNDLNSGTAKNIAKKSSLLEEIKQALILGIKDYFQKTNFKKAYIGISGGIDSALVACLAVEALGKDSVIGIMMPSIYSSENSLKDGQALIDNLQIDYKTISIQSILEAYLQETPIEKLTLAEENLQSRIRGNILMGMANSENALVLATGNKSEFSVGYSTLYGDMCGALAPIGDIWKTMVWDLSKLFPSIPQNIIDKPPSAELRPNQFDTDSLPDYSILDFILISYLEEGLSSDQILHKFAVNNIQNRCSSEYIQKIIDLFHKAEFKRKQAPIILKINNTAFGSGWLYPVARIISA